MSRRQTKAEKRERWARQQEGRTPVRTPRPGEIDPARLARREWSGDTGRPKRVEWRPDPPATPFPPATLVVGGIRCGGCGEDLAPMLIRIETEDGEELWCEECAPELFAQAREAMR